MIVSHGKQIFHIFPFTFKLIMQRNESRHRFYSSATNFLASAAHVGEFDHVKSSVCAYKKPHFARKN